MIMNGVKIDVGNDAELLNLRNNALIDARKRIFREESQTGQDASDSFELEDGKFAVFGMYDGYEREYLIREIGRKSGSVCERMRGPR